MVDIFGVDHAQQDCTDDYDEPTGYSGTEDNGEKCAVHSLDMIVVDLDDVILGRHIFCDGLDTLGRFARRSHCVDEDTVDGEGSAIEQLPAAGAKPAFVKKSLSAMLTDFPEDVARPHTRRLPVDW